MTHEQIIADLGGTAKLAEALGQKLNTVSMWRTRGVPWRFRPAVAALAKRKRIAVPPEFLDPAQ